jgi:hypothetical protein
MPNFIQSIQQLLSWLNHDAALMTKEEVIDKVKVSLLDILKRFLSFPHTSNFAMMPQNGLPPLSHCEA